jgi:AICAR transformylase/IMP cyclohydrolase PurH
MVHRCRCLKMPRQLVNREELGKLIAQTSGTITMISESNYNVRSKSVITHVPSLQLNQVGFVHVQIIHAIMPSASIYMQLNSIAEARHISLLDQVACAISFTK